jgi:predicted nuclease of predicted toxin-antitoxin system
MRFLLDEDLNPKAALIGKRLGIDVVSVHDIGRRGLNDREQLEFAAEEHRILVTRNRDDFIRLTVAFFHAGSPHCGILIAAFSLPNKQPTRVARALKRWSDRQRRYGEPGAYFIDFLTG